MTKTQIPEGPDDYRVEQNCEPGTRDFGRWFVVGGNRKMKGHPQSYASKAGARNLLKRLNESDPKMQCPMCNRTGAEIRDADPCCIDSINCTDHHRFPSKGKPEKMHRIETRNDLVTVYAAIEDPVTMALDRADLPILGFKVMTKRILIRDDGTEIFVDCDDILDIINGEY